MGLKIKNVNDVLALVVMIVVVPGLWVANRWLQLPGEVIGATIALWTIVGQYYFRRSPAPPTQ